jgi:hypothetical protein
MKRRTIITTVLSGAVLLGAGFLIGCCPKTTVVLSEPRTLPTPEQLVFPVPAEVHASAGAATQISMHNVSFHVDDDLTLGIHRLRGVMKDAKGGNVVVLDDRKGLALDIDNGEIGITARGLSLLLNRYVFGYPGSPLKDLNVRIEGDHIVQTGTMHKLIDIPFEMTASLSVTPDGWIRIHPTKMEICNLDGQKLLQAVGQDLEKMLDLSGAKGVKAVGNDLLLDPMASLPPPKITGRITAIRVTNDEVVQTFGEPAGRAPVADLTPPEAAANYVYFRGGTLRFGKLYMVETDLITIDADPKDPFDFYVDYYHSQLVAGRHITLPNYGLVAWLPDFADLAKPSGIPRR